MHQNEAPPKSKQYLLAAVLLTSVSAAAVGVWLAMTPAGFLGKLRAIAYSVCQQDPEHTLMIGYRLLPLCARCTGMFLGSLIGLTGFATLTEGGGYPTRKFRWLLGAFVLFFAMDGLNSAVFTFLYGRALYTPTNFLRLASGLAMGMTIAAVLVPLWRQVMQRQDPSDPGLLRWRQFLSILLTEILTGAAILLAPGWMYLPIALVSTLAVPILVTMVYTLLWTLALKKEATIRNRMQRFSYIALGCLTALIQIGVMDLLRFAITGTWAGMQI